MTDLTGMDPKVMREVAEEIAGEIKQLAETFRAFERSSLNKRAVLLILSDAAKVSKRDIEKVLTAAAELDKRYLKRGK